MPKPSAAFRIVSEASTDGQLSSGSPMPMNTTLVGRSAGSRRTISRTWPAISNGERLRRKPIRPVAQNEHRSAQPPWLEMQRVRRVPDGMRTDSIASPSARRQRNLRVPSEESCSTSAARRGMGKASSSSARSPSGSSVASVQAATGACQSRRAIWPAR